MSVNQILNNARISLHMYIYVYNAPRYGQPNYKSQFFNFP